MWERKVFVAMLFNLVLSVTSLMFHDLYMYAVQSSKHFCFTPCWPRAWSSGSRACVCQFGCTTATNSCSSTVLPTSLGFNCNKRWRYLKFFFSHSVSRKIFLTLSSYKKTDSVHDNPEDQQQHNISEDLIADPASSPSVNKMMSDDDLKTSYVVGICELNSKQSYF